jgi:predicted nucleic acid-binding protein
MYLLDTNIWLERLLDQARSDEVGRFLDKTPSEHLSMTDFTLHSIGVVLGRLKQSTVLLSFVQDTLIDGAVHIINLQPPDLAGVVTAMQSFNLDFDDAYQYVAAMKYDLILLTFDMDFDRTDLPRLSPGEALRR